MDTVTVADREALERLYPRAAFEEDAALNAVGNAQVVHGVRIEAAPDAPGRFRLTRVKHHTGESARSEDAVFLMPDHQGQYAALIKSETDYGGPQEKGNELAEAHNRDRGYAGFINRIVEAMRSADFPKPSGRAEERLKGFHGG
jgi:hypothetical protein